MYIFISSNIQIKTYKNLRSNSNINFRGELLTLNIDKNFCLLLFSFYCQLVRLKYAIFSY